MAPHRLPQAEARLAHSHWLLILRTWPTELHKLHQEVGRSVEPTVPPSAWLLEDLTQRRLVWARHRATELLGRTRSAE